MPEGFVRETIENWVSDFCGGDGLRAFGGATREYAGELLTRFLCAACDVRDLPPGELEESDLRAALLDDLATLQIPESVRGEVPDLCGALLTQLEAEGRLGGGRVLGAFVRALRDSFVQKASGKGVTHVRAGSKIGRNDPCPCGSGKKYKKCCMRE